MPDSAVPDSNVTSRSRAAAAPSGPRLLSLDVFRGITIAAMILVNNPGSWSYVYAPLKHAPWNGCTPTDLIFPCFVFIVGVAMTYSLGKVLQGGASRRELLLKATQRALSILMVGLVLHGFMAWGYDQAHLRIPGVLQRIGIVYLFAAGIYLYTGVRGQIAAALALLIGYWGLQTLVPVPGGAAGVLRPGEDLGAYIDRAIFTTDHLWQSKTWDPEGLLSTLPAIATALLGGLTGTWLRSNRSPLEKAAALFVMSSAAIVAGVVWSAVFPLNKSLWTSSYVLFTAGLAGHVLAICYYLFDIRGFDIRGLDIRGLDEITGYRRWAAPFVVYGTNAIAAYVLSSAVAVVLDVVQVGEGVDLKTAIFTGLYRSWLAPIDASLLFAITYVLFWLAVMAVLYKRRIFIKL